MADIDQIINALATRTFRQQMADHLGVSYEAAKLRYYWAFLVHDRIDQDPMLAEAIEACLSKNKT